MPTPERRYGSPSSFEFKTLLQERHPILALGSKGKASKL